MTRCVIAASCSGLADDHVRQLAVNELVLEFIAEVLVEAIAGAHGEVVAPPDVRGRIVCWRVEAASNFVRQMAPDASSATARRDRLSY